MVHLIFKVPQIAETDSHQFTIFIFGYEGSKVRKIYMKDSYLFKQQTLTRIGVHGKLCLTNLTAFYHLFFIESW